VNLLILYLRDHLTLSLAAIRLARRCQRENQDNPVGAYLGRLLPELEEDRQALEDALRALGGAPSPLSAWAATAGELLGRLKLNGRLFGYSALSRVWELEVLVAGSDSRRRLWKSLGALSRREPKLAGRAFEVLEQRALAQGDALERLRARAAEDAFTRHPAAARPLRAPAHAPP
jgi:hypothetical protein